MQDKFYLHQKHTWERTQKQPEPAAKARAGERSRKQLKQTRVCLLQYAATCFAAKRFLL